MHEYTSLKEIIEYFGLKNNTTNTKKEKECEPKIIEIFNNPKEVRLDVNNEIHLYWMGLYYYTKNTDEDELKMLEYFKWSLRLNNNNIKCLSFLGDYYNATKDYELMKYYYLMAIKKAMICTL